jgi:hypothetical protein
MIEFGKLTLPFYFVTYMMGGPVDAPMSANMSLLCPSCLYLGHN